MISLNNISVSFGGVSLFEDLSLVINPMDRIALVGKNGVGKSTLMKILIGKASHDKGTVVINTGETIGYLPQEITVSSKKSVFDETMMVFNEVTKMEEDIKHVTHELENRTDYESDSYINLIEKLTDLHERLEMMEGKKKEGDVEKILKGLGFSQEELLRPVSSFSGGWQMRVELAKLLIVKPSLMLMDEPTNHLDIESILWLEEFFSTYSGAIMLVSHDKMFLDNVTTRTVEIVFGQIHDYKVNYSKYVTLREERFLQQEAAFKNQQKYIAQQEKFIERFRAKNTKAKQVQSKMKQLGKIERVKFDHLDHSSIQFRFSSAQRSGEVVLSSKKSGKTYGEKEVLKNVDFVIERGEKIAFVGKNGMGKTTMIKLITGEETYKGEIDLGYNVTLGYYAQIQEKTLDENQTVLQVIENIATGEMAKTHRVRALLGAFLFGDDDVDKKVKVLSGGEKSRLALAKLLLEPCNLLILDEPTNHLDMASKEVLKEALKLYDGTLIVVSHDRDFLSGLTQRTFEFINKGIKEHLGSVDDFLNYHKAQNFRSFEIVEKNTKSSKSSKSKSDNSSSKTIPEQNDKKPSSVKQIKELKISVKRCENKIEELESELKTLEEEINLISGESTVDKSELFYKHGDLQRKLDEFLRQWEENSSQLEKLENR